MIFTNQKFPNWPTPTLTMMELSFPMKVARQVCTGQRRTDLHNPRQKTKLVSKALFLVATKRVKTVNCGRSKTLSKTLTTITTTPTIQLTHSTGKLRPSQSLTTTSLFIRKARDMRGRVEMMPLCRRRAPWHLCRPLQLTLTCHHRFYTHIIIWIKWQETS